MPTVEISPKGPYARLNCRVSARIKSRVEEAAGLLGQSITDFTELAIAEKAELILAQNDRIILSERAFAHFLKVIETGSTPTQKLRSDSEEYRRLKSLQPESNW